MQGIESDPVMQARLAALRQALQSLGWIEGHNIQIDYRWYAADTQRARASAIELVDRGAEVILAAAPPGVLALREATRTTPIVFVGISDPVGAGFVDNLAHPGGNMTGFTQFEFTIAGKWLELLKECAPRVTRAGVIRQQPETPQGDGFLRNIEVVAPSLSVTIIPSPVSDGAGIEAAVKALARDSGGGLIVLPGPVATTYAEQIVLLTSQWHVPAIYSNRFMAAAGGLISYGIDTVDQFRSAAFYMNRILKGENPGDLPVQEPTKFELVINLKTAKALGLMIPESFLLRADEVIE
jgi:putative tryptophan/tyrosine transport system substrate-binding protein